MDEVELCRSLRRADRHLGEFGHAVFRPGALAMYFASVERHPVADPPPAANSASPPGDPPNRRGISWPGQSARNPNCSDSRINGRVAI